MNIQITEDAESLWADCVAWNSLSGGVPFRQTQWLRAWWRHVGCKISNGTARPALVVGIGDDGELRGALPLYRCGGGRTLRAMGDGNACSDHLSVLCQPDDAAELSTAIGEFLSRIAVDVSVGWDMLDFNGAVEGDQRIAAVVNGLRDSGSRVHSYSRMSVWRKPRDRDWETHLRHHGKTQRRRMRRWTEKFDSIDGAERFVASTETEVTELTDEIIALHQRRWTDAGEAGTYADPSFRNFIHEAVLEFHRSGDLYLSALKLDGKTIAGEINFVGGDRVLYSYSSGYDIDHAEIEPGRIMCVDGLLEMYRGDLAAVDFLRGDEPYKERFATQSRRVYTVRAFAPELLPRVRYAGYRTAFEMKQWMRKRAGRPLLSVTNW